MRFIPTLLSLFVATSVAVPAPVPLIKDRAPVQQYSGTYTFITLVPPCYPPSADAEIVEFSVSYKGHFSNTEDNGVVTYKGHYNNHGTGVGQTSGLKYEMREIDNTDETYTFAPPYDQHVHYETHFKINKQGSGQVVNIRANVDYTYDQNNGLVFKIDNTSDSCYE